jgi:hypothetical protein
MRSEKYAQNRIPLCALFEPQAHEMLTENALRILQHLLGCVRLVIDAHFGHCFGASSLDCNAYGAQAPYLYQSKSAASLAN